MSKFLSGRVSLSEAYCTHCKRNVCIDADGTFVTHGPQGDEMRCEGSGQKATEKRRSKAHASRKQEAQQ